MDDEVGPFLVSLVAMLAAFTVLDVLLHGFPRRDHMSEPANFFMVWTKTGHLPRRMHDDFAGAENEAQRLARMHPGKKFIVLKAVAKYGVAPLTETAPAAESEPPHTGDST